MIERSCLSCHVKVLHSISQQVELSQLRAYTTYEVYVSACTLAGCTPSPSISLTTSSDLPMNLRPATVENITATSAQIVWTDPQVPNGPILRSAAISLIRTIRHTTKTVLDRGSRSDRPRYRTLTFDLDVWPWVSGELCLQIKRTEVGPDSQKKS